MAYEDQVRINGNAVSWSSTIFKIAGERVTGVASVAWDQKRERTLVYGMNRSHAPIGRTAGKYTPGVLKCKFLKHTAVAMRTLLATYADDGKSYGNARVDNYLQYVEPNTLNVSTVEFLDCCVVSEGDSDEESADARFEEWEFSVMRIITDGTTEYDSSQEF